MQNPKFVISFTLAFGTLIFSQANGQEQKQEKSAELKVLERFMGTWDVNVTLTPIEGKTTTFKGVETRKWSSGGKFVHFETHAHPEFHMLVTYDPTTRMYPGMMMHGSDRRLVDGRWDEKNRTMTFTGKHVTGENSFVFKNHFIDEDNVETTGVITDSDGKIVMKQTHKQSRRSNR